MQIFGPLAEQLNNLMAVRVLKSIHRLADYSENVLLQCLNVGTAMTYRQVGNPLPYSALSHRLRQDDTITIENTEAHDITIIQV